MTKLKPQRFPLGIHFIPTVHGDQRVSVAASEKINYPYPATNRTTDYAVTLTDSPDTTPTDTFRLLQRHRQEKKFWSLPGIQNLIPRSPTPQPRH